MAFTIEQLNVLDAAIAQGVLEVEYSDKRVKYRSLNEMLQTRAIMAASVGGKRESRAKYPSFNKGL